MHINNNSENPIQFKKQVKLASEDIYKMFTALVVGFLLLEQTSANVKPHDPTMDTLFYHTDACDTQVS